MQKDNRSFKQAVDDRLASVVLSPQLKEKIRAGTCKAAGSPAAEKKKPIRLRRAVTVAVAACMVLVLGIGVAAGVFPWFDWFIERMGEDMRESVYPVAATDTQDGVRMDVLAAVNDGDAAVIYVSLTDEEAQRIDETTQVYELSAKGIPLSWGEQVDYDAETGSAIFRMEVSHGEDLGGKEITLTLGSVLVGTARHESIDTGLTLADIIQQNPQPQVNGTNLLDDTGTPVNGFGGYYGRDPQAAEPIFAALNAGTMPLLQRGSMPLDAENLPWLQITAAGVVGDYLHIQHQPAGEGGAYSTLDFYLSYPGGPQEPFEVALAAVQVNLGETQQVGYHQLSEYYETILQIPQDVPYEDISIAARGTTCEGIIQGGWSTTFTLEYPAEVLSAACDIDLNGWKVERIAISPIGITAYASGEFTAESEALSMELWMKDGTMAEITTTSISANYQVEGSAPSIMEHNSFARPILLEDVDKLVVNGEEIALTLEELIPPDTSASQPTSSLAAHAA